MTEVKVESEPTMEEILASIRRIISDDNEPEKEKEASASVPPPEAESPPEPVMPVEFEDADDVLELTEVVPEEQPPFVLQARPPEPEHEAPEEQLESARPLDSDRLVSDATAAASSAAFSAMNGMFNFRRDNELPLGNGAITLEELVRDLVSPMLRQWLDDNLPKLVERLVQEEIRRIARDAQ